MFDFIRWRGWLEGRAAALQLEGFETALKLSDHSPKSGTALEIAGRRTLAIFTNWSTVETDYDITDINAKMISHKWGLVLNDLSFEAAFNDFVDELRGHERSTSHSGR